MPASHALSTNQLWPPATPAGPQPAAARGGITTGSYSPSEGGYASGAAVAAGGTGGYFTTNYNPGYEYPTAASGFSHPVVSEGQQLYDPYTSYGEGYAPYALPAGHALSEVPPLPTGPPPDNLTVDDSDLRYVSFDAVYVRVRYLCLFFIIII